MKTNFKNFRKDILAKTIQEHDKSLPGISLFAHSVIVGIVCEEFIKVLPKKFVEKYNLKNFPFIVSLHDLGKASPGFQEMLKLNIGNSTFKSFVELKDAYETTHEFISAEFLRNNFENIFEDIPCVISMIKWHHGKNRVPGQIDDFYDMNKVGYDEWDKIRSEFFKELRKVFEFNEKEFVHNWKKLNCGDMYESVKSPDVKYCMGLLCVCDWIGSDEDLFNPNIFNSDCVDIDFIRSVAKKALEDYGFSGLEIIKDLSFQNIFDNFIPNDIQSTLGNLVDSSGIYILEAPMGHGKTEAAEFAAYKALEKGLVDGVYFAMPTQTTSNSIFKRYKNFVEKISNIKKSDIRLMHSKSIFADVVVDSNSGMKSWFEGKRSILSPFGLGTLDQALMSVLGNIKHFYLRTFGLSRKCVILDEIHSYDTYTKTLTVEMINQLLKLDCVVILLSATLTRVARKELCGYDIDITHYPSITKVANNNISVIFFKTELPNKTIELEVVKVETNLNKKNSTFIDDRMKYMKDVIERVSSGQLVLWIENSVKEAQEVFSYFNRKKIDCGLLHSRYTNKHREENETYWVERFGKNSNRESGCVLVSTQVCEQSIDIDADYLVTAICPTDMLLQRIGRLHRHKNDKRKITPKCLILTFESYEITQSTDLFNFRNEIGASAYVYHPYVLRKTHLLFKDKTSINNPKDIRNLLEETYRIDNNDDLSNKFLVNLIGMNRNNKNEANTSLEYVNGNNNDEFGSNIDDPEPNYDTRKIDINTIDVCIIENKDGNVYNTILGDKISLHNNLKLFERKIMNDSSVKIDKSFIDNNKSLFIEDKVGKSTYYFCQVKNDQIVDQGTKAWSDHHYSKKFGFMKK